MKKIASMLAILAITMGLLTASSVVTAEKAEAATQSCRYVDAGYGKVIGGSPWPGYRYGVLCYVDYNWWEENFWPWPRDGYFWQVFQNQYCAYPARLYVSNC